MTTARSMLITDSETNPMIQIAPDRDDGPDPVEPYTPGEPIGPDPYGDGL